MRIYVIASAQHNSPFGSEPAKDDTPVTRQSVAGGRRVARADGRHGPMGDKGNFAAAKPVSKSEGSNAGATRWKINGFPKIPGVRYQGLHNRQLFLDYGPHIMRGRMDVHPPRPIGNGAYKILVPKVDRDGNDIAGIRLPAIQVPIGTYTGWNLRPRGLAEDELSGLLGSFIPFAKTKAERSKLRDPRLSLKERYKNHSDYVKKISHAARILVDQRYLLPDDAQRMIDEAKKRHVP